MFAAIHLPCFQFQAITLGGAAGPSALLDEVVTGTPLAREQACVLQVNAEAERLLVHPGMTASMARARCATLQFLYRDAGAELAAQKVLMQCSSNRTPFYESTSPGLCVLDLSSLPGVRGCELAYGKAICEELAQSKLTARVGFARQADLAILAAHTASPVRVMRGEEDDRACLGALPLAVLQPTWQTAEVFALWGVKQVGDLCKLPRAGVTERLGREGMLLWDLATGGGDRLLRLVRPAPGYRLEEDFEHAIECLEPLLFILRRHLQNLCDRLGATWRVAAAAVVELYFEDGSQHRRELRIAEPTRDVELLFRVIHTALEGVTAAAPIKGLGLELRAVTPAGSQSLLFERTLKDPNRFAETLAHLEAVVGAGNVGRVRLLPSRRLDAFAVTGFFENEKSATPPRALEVSTCSGLPLRRLRPAPVTQVFLVDQKPAAFRNARYSQAVTACDGPWLVSGDWWDVTQAWRREIWIVTGEDGGLYQLARHRNGEWVMEGLLG